MKGHSQGSKKELSVPRENGTKFIPHIWEISAGLDRTFFAIIDSSFRKQKDRTWLSLPVAIAPVQVGIFPLLSNRPEIVERAKSIFKELKSCYECFYDESGSIGKRYARADEVGVPFCITVDFDSLKNDDVTIRDRDSTLQKRVKIANLRDTLFNLLTGKSSFPKTL